MVNQQGKIYIYPQFSRSPFSQTRGPNMLCVCVYVCVCVKGSWSYIFQRKVTQDHN